MFWRNIGLGGVGDTTDRRMMAVRLSFSWAPHYKMKVQKVEAQLLRVLNSRDGRFASSLALPSECGRLTALARAISLDASYPASLWIRETGIWPSSENRFLFDLFRKSSGCELPLEDYPLQIFEPGEQNLGWSAISLALYFGWDFAVIEDGLRIVWTFSHDGMMAVSGFTLDDLNRGKGTLQDMGYES